MFACFRVLSYNLVLGHFFYFSTFAALSTYLSGCVLCPFDKLLFFALCHCGSRNAELSLPISRVSHFSSELCSSYWKIWLESKICMCAFI